MLTEEGRLLQQMQTDDYDIDGYTSKLDLILARKQELIGMLYMNVVLVVRIYIQLNVR